LFEEKLLKNAGPGLSASIVTKGACCPLAQWKNIVGNGLAIITH
jgi:hypothetical protein